MKYATRIFAALLAALLAVSFTACHKKDEIAVTVGDVNFTSAYYMCALINADVEAKSKVDEQLKEEKDGEESDTESDTEVDYYAQKIEDKPYVEWVEDKAMDYLKKLAAYKTLCKENKLEIPQEDLSNAQSYAASYWSYGYSSYFEPNGVSQATYTQYLVDAYYANLYFDFLYGEEGEKAIDSKTVNDTMIDRFVIADTIEATYPTDDKTDDNGNVTSSAEDQKAALKTRFEAYAAALKDGSKTFEEVYVDYNGPQEEQTQAETEQTEENATPKDSRATLMGPEDTGYESDYYETVKSMKVGEVKLEETDTGVVLLLKQDISGDPYYAKTLDSAVRHLLKDDEFDEQIKEYLKKMTVTVNRYAVKQFKVKKIQKPEQA